MVSSRDIQDEWTMNSSWTFHMTSRLDYLIDLQVLLEDNGVCNMKETESVLLVTHDGLIRSLTNVRYVLELKRNLVSLGELDKVGYSYKSDKGVRKVSKGSMVKLKGTLTNGLYVLKCTTIT